MLDPSAHCPFYDTCLKKMFSNPEQYAKAFCHSWQAEQFRAGEYDLATFTPAILHPDWAPKITHTFAQGAGSGLVKKKKKTKRLSGPEVAREGDRSIMPPSSLPLASRRFFAARTDPATHALSQRITAAFPDIAAATLTYSNRLLPKGFIAKVNNRGAVSLTGTDSNTPAESYTPYFDALTRCLNQSFPIVDNPWLPFTKAPTTVQLAIHSIATHILPDDYDQPFNFIKKSIENAREVTISAAWYLNQSRPVRLTKQATSVVGSIKPDDVPILLPAFFLFSKRLKVEKTTEPNRYTHCTNCYRCGHAHARCTQKHPTWPYCALHHTHSAHRCHNPTCPKGGDSRAIPDCCPTSPPHYPNCGEDHDAFSKECRARPIPPPQPEATPPSDEELSDLSADSEEAMDVGDDGQQAPSTAKAHPTQIVDLSTARPHHDSRNDCAPPQRAPSSTHWPGLATGNSLQPSGSSQK